MDVERFVMLFRYLSPWGFGEHAKTMAKRAFRVSTYLYCNYYSKYFDDEQSVYMHAFIYYSSYFHQCSSANNILSYLQLKLL